MMFPEENSELEKQMGCMAGIFQIFDRGNLLSGRRFNRHSQKRLPSGNASLKGRENPVEQKKSSQQAILEKTLSKSLTENSSLSMESSRPSCSSSSCSSFSSANEVFFTEKLSKDTLRPKTAPCYSDFRNIVKESINREPNAGMTVKTTPKEEMPKNVLKHKDSPRPLLLSKSSDGTYVISIDRSINYEYELKCNSYYTSRFSCDGRELQNRVNMGPKDSTKPSTGLRDLPRLSLDSRKESLTTCGTYDSPGHRRSNSLIARLMGLDLFPDTAENGNASKLETSNPVESFRNRRDNCLSNFSKSNMRENDVSNLVNPTLVVKTKTPMRVDTESAPWIQQEKIGNKMMASAIENRFQKVGLHAKELLQIKRGVESPRSVDSPIVIMKPAKYGTRTTNAASCNVNPTAGLTALHKLQSGSSEEQRKPSTSSPKTRDRNQGTKLKQSSREDGANSPRTSPSSPRISPINSDLDRKSRPSSPSSPRRNLVSDSSSPRSKVKPKSFQTKITLGQKSAEVDFTDPFRPQLQEKILDKETAVVSPVSVLIPSFYHDELTPVKRLSDSFREGETCTSEESWNPASLPDTPPSIQIKSENIETLIQKLEQLSSANDEVPCGDPIIPYKPENQEHEYIKEILTASGLLHKDLSSFMLPQHAEHPINPDLFFVLEQTKSANKIHRKLTFDLVNEIIGEMLEQRTFPMVSSERYACMKKLGGEQLLEELCTKIDKIQKVVITAGSDGTDENEDDNCQISSEEAIREMRGWDKFNSEFQGMVLEIERSVYKDLVDELIELESSEIIKQRKIRRQLF
ncbi:LONGIFOLIA protein [Rhynchospora pubera]|uniref:LONGIFOLIA protein n=1 Tax=Rhynchospora pubera TaxID=906938 RepID=A0AAV8D2X6_9POAL|nr:LONGIFOLIA protein [Rhynchospora pubera]